MHLMINVFLYFGVDKNLMICGELPVHGRERLQRDGKGLMGKVAWGRALKMDSPLV